MNVRAGVRSVARYSATSARAAKYASARSIGVELAPAGGRARLVVEDDGRGFDPAAVRAEHGHGLGLYGMRERAGLVGGSLQLRTQPGGGTRVTADVALAERPT